MDAETKVAFGQILGEIYSIKNKLYGDKQYDEAVIEALINGYEPIIDNHLRTEYSITNEKHSIITKAFNEIFIDKKRLAEFVTAYELEDMLNPLGIERWEIIASCRIFKANHQFWDMLKIISEPGSSACEYNSCLSD